MAGAPRDNQWPGCAMARARIRVPLTSGDARRSVARFGRSPRTAAVALLPASAYGSEAWHSARRAMVGASEMAAVLGISPYASPFSMWWAKQEGWESEQTQAMYIGHVLEPVIAKLFADVRPDLLVCRPMGSLWRHPDVDWVGCTPDYLAVAEDDNFDDVVYVEPVECKSDEGGRGWGRPGTGDVPDHHRVQVIQQCAVFGSPRGHLVRLAGKRLTAYVVEFDDAARVEWAEWLREGQSFVASLETGVPPDVDGHKATTAALQRLQPAVDDASDELVADDVAAEYERLDDRVKATKAELERVKNVIRETLGDARYGLVASTGRRFVDRRVFKRREHYVPPSMVDAIYRVAAPGGPRHHTTHNDNNEE